MIIRKATLKDSESIASYLFLAMKEIVFRFIGEEDDSKAKDFLRHFVEKENNQYSYQNCWVAEEQHEIIAAANLYDGARLEELRQPVTAYLKERFQQDVTPEDETQPGEYYIDTLGVREDQQGKGVGSKILQFLIDEHVVKNQQTLGLLVDEENPEAKKLYLKLGFKSVGKCMLVGKQMEHLQISRSSLAETGG